MPRKGHKPLELTPDAVNRIHEIGGTVLGSSRGPQDPAEMVDTLETEDRHPLRHRRRRHATRRAGIGEEAARRGLAISVIGIPKTIDNDVSFMQKTFGFETAVTEARRATYAAHTEAEAARNGIGLVKLMGRDSGFIAAFSVLADSQVNFCLVPEVPFTLERFLAELEQRLERRGHAVIVVAEGAGQDLMAEAKDAMLRGTSSTAISAPSCGTRSRNISSGPAWRSASSTSTPATPSGACRPIPMTRPSACFSGIVPCMRE